MDFILAFVLVQVLCAVGVLADYWLKMAGTGSSFIEARSFLIGFVLHSSTAVGWFFVLKYMKLIQVGVLYSVSITLMLTALAVYQFNETLTGREILGLVLAVISVVLLSKYS